MIKGKGTVAQELATLEKELSTLIFRNPFYTFKNELDSVRHIIKCQEILKKVTFQTFDVKEWIVENDSLVCQIKAQTENGFLQIQPVVDSFESLMQRVKGLPPDSSFICYEQAIAYNLSHLLFQGQICHSMVDGFHKCASFLQNSLLRACECLKVKAPTMEGDIADEGRLSPLNDQHFQELVPSLFQALTKNSIGCAPFVLSICLLALLQLLEGRANVGVQLLSLTKCQLDSLKDGSLGITEELPSSLPIFLFHLENISSVPSCVVSSSVQDSRDIQTMVSVVTSLLAFFYLSCKQYDDALRILCEKGDAGEEISFNDLYLKGYILYIRNDVNGALSCLQQCLLITSANYRSAVLNMIGCCCVRKGKHHTAVAKFREALEQDFQRLEPLFNISLQYRKLGNYAAEIRSLELLKQALKCKRKGDEGLHHVTVMSTAIGNHNGLNDEILDMELSFPPRFGVAWIYSTGVTREFVGYVLAKRRVELGRYEDGAKNYLDLLATILLEVSVSSHVNPSKLPNPLELYRQCAYALLKAARYEDTVTVCDKVLSSSSYSITPTAEDSDRATNSKSVTREYGDYPRKRLRSSEEERGGVDTGALSDNIAMLLYKADALVHLKQPLEALQSLNRILKALKGIYWPTFQSGQQSDETQQEPRRKRRKLACGDISASFEQNQGCQLNKLVKIKVQAYNKKATILEGLGQTLDALQQLHLALECLPGKQRLLHDNLETVYKHTQLLFKVGRSRDAALNWLRFRQVENTNTHKVDLQSIRDSLSSSASDFSDVDLSAAQVEATDELALKWWSKSGDL